MVTVGIRLILKGFSTVMHALICKPFPSPIDLIKRRKGFIDVGKRLNLSKVEKVRLKHNFIEPILSYLFCTLKRILLTNNRSLKFDTFPGMLKLTPVKLNAVLTNVFRFCYRVAKIYFLNETGLLYIRA